MGYTWNKDYDGSYLVKDRLLQLSEKEAQAYYKAADTLYEMYEEAAAYVIERKLYADLDIAPSLVKLIEKSFKEQRDEHLYGRFDLSGGLDGLPIKLIEFNADTPTLLLESAVIQWMILEYNKLQDAQQANQIYNAISEKIKSLKTDKEIRFLFSSVESIQEEIHTTKLLQNMARDAGVFESFSYLHQTFFEDGKIQDTLGIGYTHWFKLFPWEDIALMEEELVQVLENTSTKVLNPAYTLLYQSKGMLKILYDLFPNSEYLLESSFEPLQGKCVKKPTFGREGANVEILQDSKRLHQTSGPYGAFKDVYQSFAEFAKDEDNAFYQAGVFYSDGACGLGFRKGGEIMDDMSQFVGHIVTS